MFQDTIKKSSTASLKLASQSHDKRCNIIRDIAKELLNNQDFILAENKKDVEEGKQSNISKALMDRLILDSDRLKAMANGMKQIIDLPDPLITTDSWTNQNGMTINKVRVPLGILLVVYEARPNVSTDTVALALKTGNAAILKGSRQTKYTNTAIAKVVSEVLEKYDLSDAIHFFPELTHEQSAELISNEDLGLIIPRGGEKLKSVVKELAKAPVIGAGGGLCHTYVSEFADLTKAKDIIHNAKTQRPSVCNSLETILLHSSHNNKDSLNKLLLPLIESNVSFIIDKELETNMPQNANYILADDNSWSVEHLDLKVSIKQVNNVDEAINHINEYSTSHSDCIVTESKEESQLFCNLVDSACVYSNVSIRFTDGEVFGFGAEIGISTQKLHARGPIGPNELTTYKYIIEGNGQTR